MRYKLLIVDDQEQQLKKYARLFANDFECFTATSGEIAVEIFDNELPHIILSDVKMPGGMSGFDLCQKIKSYSPQTIIVLASSYNNTADRIKGYEARADEYLNKMTTDQEVYLKVRNLLFTKNNIPATFASEESEPLKSADSFEDDVRNILTSYYQTASHLRSADKIDLKIIAKTIHKSQRTVQRDFSKKIGCTFSDFHNNVRLDIAAHLLLNSDKSIKDIAEELSYSSPSIFSKNFKQVHGVTPSKYRYNYKEEV